MLCGVPSSGPRVPKPKISITLPPGSWTVWPRSTRASKALRPHGRYLGAITLDQPPCHRPHIAFSDNVGPRALGQRLSFLGIPQQPDHVTGELGRIVGQRADVTVFISQTFRAQSSGDYGNTCGKRLQKFYAYTGARQNWADKQGVAHQWLAHILHKSDHLDGFRVPQRMPRRRIGAHDHQPGSRFFLADARKYLLQEPLQRLHIRQVTEATEE